jgi:uncharacterized protein YxeA
MKKQITLSLTAIILVAIGSQYFIHKMENDRLENIYSEYEVCLDTSHTGYEEDWNLNCSILGKEDECALDSEIADNLESKYMVRKNTCIKEMEAKK